MRCTGFVVVLSLLVAWANVANADGKYATAYRQSQKTGQPLLVLIGADWCPACVKMKEQIIPVLRNRGLLEQVAFAELDKDRSPKTAAKLMSGETVPQLVLFYRTAEGWKRQRLVGAGSVATIDAMLQRSLDRVAVAPATAKAQ